MDFAARCIKFPAHVFALDGDEEKSEQARTQRELLISGVARELQVLLLEKTDKEVGEQAVPGRAPGRENANQLPRRASRHEIDQAARAGEPRHMA